jgi:hypothetical protein
MSEISPSISSAATMIYCTIAKVHCKCTWAKKLTSAGSYHGEILRKSNADYLALIFRDVWRLDWTFEGDGEAKAR